MDVELMQGKMFVAQRTRPKLTIALAARLVCFGPRMAVIVYIVVAKERRQGLLSLLVLFPFLSRRRRCHGSVVCRRGPWSNEEGLC